MKDDEAASADAEREIGDVAEGEGLTRHERSEAIKRSEPSAPVLYAAIAARGREELERPALSLFGSAITAGLVIMLSLMTQGILMAILPDFPGSAAVTDLGYTVGFAAVILGRMQLFTENTITPVLPLLAEPSRAALWRTARLWGIVLAGNMVGTFIAAFTLYAGGVLSAAHYPGVLEAAEHAVAVPPLELLRLAVPAGFIIAAMVWCMPAVGSNGLLLILVMTYVIALGDFAHVVVGSGEVFLTVMEGIVAPGRGLTLIAAAFTGNVIGGTCLFALLAYLQVREEMEDDAPEQG